MNDLIKIEEDIKQLSTIDKFSATYLYINQLKKRITELEETLKKKGAVMMLDNDIKNISVGDHKITWIDPTQTENYRPSSVIEALGMERAVAFLKVDSKIKDYLKKASAIGAVTMQEVEKCKSGLTKTRKKGYLKIQKNAERTTLLTTI